ncbi:MAG: SDR family oxidoreductase [Anaerolineae bacterium]|jgi:NAD(P)-dependent dehydrogenase (short-subunit alcohol dehydrogenase family)|nr:MAG: SDR family oxidoreductase [Anaerolineae bacterium]
MPDKTTVVVGGTSEFGKRVGKHYADQGHKVYLTSRDKTRADEVAREIGGSSIGLALDLTEPHSIAGALAGVNDVQHLIITSILRDHNMVKEYDIDAAIKLVTMKLVGYTEVIHQLASRMHRDASIVLYGGLAKDRPYPGSTTVTTVNGGVTSMINSLALQLAPIRVNAIHSSVVGDSPFWASKPAEVLEAFRARTPIGRLVEIDDVVHATIFLLENKATTGVNLRVDGGWLIN